jgi:predicted kinase
MSEMHRRESRSVGVTVWFTGLPCSGKTTVSRRVFEQLHRGRVKVELLDGDVVRQRLTIELIRGSSGVAVLAHPATLGLTPDRLEACIEQLISEGLNGIEVYWSKHDKSEVSFYEKLARR